jgi:hypothetical protein
MDNLHIWKISYKSVYHGSDTDTVNNITGVFVITGSVDVTTVINTIKNHVELKSAQYEFIQLTSLEYIGESEIIEG